MIKKALLIIPSNTMPADSIRRLATPLGLLYLASVLESDYQVKIIDSTCEGYFNHYFNSDKTYITYGLSDADLKKQIADFAPDIVGVSCMFTARTSDALHTCKLVKEIDSTIPVVLGGIQGSLSPDEILDSGVVDFIIMGEGEFRLKSLIESLNKSKAPDFDGVAYLKKGKHVINYMQNRIQDLDSIPLPARHLINMEKYIEIGVPFAPFSRRDRVEQILTSRGCPQHCNFCSSVAYWGRQYRARSVDNIMKEVELLVSKYNIQELQFTDDNLTMNRKRAMDLFTRLTEYKLSWCTPNGLMMRTLDEPMIKLMAKSGAYQITCAIESGSPRVREEIIHKNVPPLEQVKRIADVARENGIQIHGTFIVGFPGETREEMEITFEYPAKAGFDSASFFIATPLLGSELFNFCKEKGYLSANPDRADLKRVNILIPSDSPDFVIDAAELEALVETKTREFNDISRQRDPQAWDVKFKRFLERHPDDADLILGRVT